jgi:cell fate regulator YaaT (PSP1 superfamily)
MSRVVGVQFRAGGKVYDFRSGSFVLEKGTRVIVKTEQGISLGLVVTEPVRYEEWAEKHPDRGELKKIFRLATDEDLDQQQKLTDRESRARTYCLQRIEARELPMKLIDVECFFDGSKIVFYFTADGRVDFRDLVKDLVHRFKTRVEMRQIGVRNEAKMLGGIGSCGRELCCCSFLGDFEPVSVKMAKEQNLSLNPTKISGLCGRLMCCLTYEYDTYCWLKRDMPKVGKRITLPDGESVKVVRQNALEQKMTVQYADGTEKVVLPADLAPADPGLPGRKKSRPRTKGDDQKESRPRRSPGKKKKPEK